MSTDFTASFWGIVAPALLALSAGCNGEPFSFVPVSGKVTYTDGSLIPGDLVAVRFVPVAPKTSGKDVAGAAIGYVSSADGTFPGVTTRKPLDGVVPGRYRVVVIAEKNGSRKAIPFDAVPQRYRSVRTTPLEVEVTRANHSLCFKVEKPP